MLSSLDAKSRTSPVGKVQSWQRDYARWVLRYIDARDYARTIRKTGKLDRLTNWQINQSLADLASDDPAIRARAYRQRKLSQRQIAAHVDGTGEQLHYVSGRTSGFAFLRFDVDAHQGQTDAVEAARFIHDDCFPIGTLYYEPTSRGWALYGLVDVGFTERAQANAIIESAHKRLVSLLRDRGFESKLEVQGRFNEIDRQAHCLIDRAQPGALPRLPRGEADWRRLKAITPMPLETLLGDGKRSEAPKPVLPRLPREIDTSNAFDRMRDAAIEMQRTLRRNPEVSELVDFYDGKWREVATVDADTYRRADGVVKWLEKNYDPCASTEAGYLACKEALLSAVQPYCTDRANRYRVPLSDEVLAVHLYVVQKTSFYINDHPRRQWTCPNDSVIAMFGMLANAGVIAAHTVTRKTIAASKAVLERAGLVECIDQNYRPGGKIRGIGKKYTIGPAHSRYTELQRFKHNVQVEYAPTYEPQPQHTNRLETSTVENKTRLYSTSRTHPYVISSNRGDDGCGWWDDVVGIGAVRGLCLAGSG